MYYIHRQLTELTGQPSGMEMCAIGNGSTSGGKVL